MERGNVTEFPSRPLDGGGGGDQFDARLRAVEGDIREVRAYMNHIPTRAWVLGGVLAGMGVAAGIAIAVFRLLSD